MYASNYYETIILNLFRGISATAPNVVYLGLFITNPGESGGGTEVSYSGYQRQPITFSAPADRSGNNSGEIGIQNVGDIVFPQSPISAGIITHAAVCDSQTGGNKYLYGKLDEPISVQPQEAPVIVNGEVAWWITGTLSNACKANTLNLLRGISLAGFNPYLAFYNGDPESGGGELSGGGYQRLPLTFSAPEEQSGGQMMIANSTQAVSNRAIAGWGTYTYSVIFGAATGGVAMDKVSRPAKEMRKGVQVIVEPATYRLQVN